MQYVQNKAGLLTPVTFSFSLTFHSTLPDLISALFKSRVPLEPLDFSTTMCLACSRRYSTQEVLWWMQLLINARVKISFAQVPNRAFITIWTLRTTANTGGFQIYDNFSQTRWENVRCTYREDFFLQSLKATLPFLFHQLINFQRTAGKTDALLRWKLATRKAK